MARESLKRLSVLMATAFVDMMGFSILLFQLPYYAESYGASPILIGWLTATFAAAQLATAPLWGRSSDRYGRRPVILAGLFASATGFLLFALSATPQAVALFGTQGALWLLFFCRLAQGAGGGTIGVVQAYVSDSSDPKDRSEVLGWVTAATSAGVVIGPALGSFSVRLGPAAPGLVALGLCVVNIAFAWRWLPESFPEEKSNGPVTARPSIRRAILDVIAEPGTPVASLIWTYAFGMLAFMSLSGPVLTLYLIRVFEISQEAIGFFVAYVASITLIMRALLLGPIVRRFGELWTMRTGALAIALGLFTLPLARGYVGLALAAAFMPIGTALLFPVTTSLLSQRFSPKETGQAMGVQQAFGGMARLVGPVWSTAVFQIVGMVAPFVISGALMIGVFLHTLRIRLPVEPHTPAVPAPEGETGVVG